MSTTSLLRKLVQRGSSLGRSVTARRTSRRHSVLETLENRQLFSLLGIVPANPTISVEGVGGSVNYSAANKTFDAVGVPLQFFDAANNIYNVTAPRGFDFHILVDNFGGLIGSGVFPGGDLVVSGSVDTTGDATPEYTGNLITGNISQFGWDTDGVTGYFEARLTVTGGSMQPLFAGKDIGLKFIAEPSDVNHVFTGDWSQDFTGKTKGAFGVIPGTGQTPPLNITGHKFKDVAGNGLQGTAPGSDDTPLANWTINLYSDNDNSGTLTAGDAPIDTTTTAADGSYAFPNLAAGNYVVAEVQQPGWVETGPATGTYGVTLSVVDANNIDFANYKCTNTCTPCQPKPPCGWFWSFWGWNYGSGGGTGGSTGGSCGGSTGGQTSGGSCTGSTGSWTWNCFKGHWGKTWTCNSGTPTPPTCTPTQETLTTALSSVSGSVWGDNDGDGKLDWCENGISGVKITLTGTDLLGNTVTKTTTTDGNGNYKFGGLIAGCYTVTETQPSGFFDGKDYAGSNGGTVLNDVIKCITVPPCSDLKCYNFTECPPAKLCGNVFNDKDGDGNKDCWSEGGLSGVKITLTGTDCNGNTVSYTTTTDGNGNYCFTGLAKGTYAVCETTPAGYSTTKNSAGSNGGCVSGDKINNVTVGCGDNACGYNFGDRKSGGWC
jgi:hypothetical protein